MAEGDAAPTTDTTTEGAGPPAAETRSDSLVQAGQDGSLLDWRSSLPENIRTAPIIARHNTLEAAAKTLIEQRQMIGRGVYLPTAEPGTPEYIEGMAKVYEKLGRPAKAADYTLTAPEGRTLDPDMSGRWQAAFHQAGLSQAQVESVMEEYWRTIQYAENVRAGEDERSKIEGRRALDAEFGASAPQMLQRARAFWEHFGAGAFGGEAGQRAWTDLEQATLPDGSRLLNKPHVIAALAEAGARIGEGEYLDSEFYRPGANTIETMQTEFHELQAKRHAGTLTPQEMDRQVVVRNQLSRALEQEATRAGRR